MKISIVVPVYNEAEGLPRFLEALYSVMHAIGLPWTCLFVDDGSVDDSWAVIEHLSRDYSEVLGLRLSRNFGHQVALSAGIEHVDGDAVITMDADLQHPPDLIPQLVAKWRQGFNIVNTLRANTPDTEWFKRHSSALFYLLLNKISDIPIIPAAADFRLLDRKAVDALLSMPERNRFLRGMVSWIGFNQTYVPFVPRPRTHGSSKFTLKKMIHLGLDGVTSFSLAPLRLALMLGIGSIGLALAYAIYVLWVKLMTDYAQPGWASLMGVVLFLGGVQLMTLGIFGEYLGKIFGETKHRPLYFVQERIGILNPPDRKRSS